VHANALVVGTQELDMHMQARMVPLMIAARCKGRGVHRPKG